MLFISIATRPADTDGRTIALAVLMPLTTVIIIVVKQLKDARYTLILEPVSACCDTPPVCTDHVLSAFSPGLNLENSLSLRPRCTTFQRCTTLQP